MHIESALLFDDQIPELATHAEPPMICGPAAIAAAAFAGAGLEMLLGLVDRPVHDLATAAAHAFDMALAHELSFAAAPARALQNLALQLCQTFRVRAGQSSGGAVPGRTLRVLALMAPGNLMVNTPLDFITDHLDVRLDLLFLLPGRKLPATVPDHDVAFFAVSESDLATLRRLMPLFRQWPRPAMNDPARIIGWSRDRLARECADVASICSPSTLRVTRAALAAHLASGDGIGAMLAGCDYPVLIRPVGSHAGAELVKIEDANDLSSYVEHRRHNSFFLTAFVDYRSDDGLFRKYRIAFFDGQPFLCHMAVSEHWMIHYLNAGMTDSVAKRQDEARAMASFNGGFARRHAAAFEVLNHRLGLDCYSIDCGETPDGRLVVFEADVAAIIHMMDPPGLFPYKQPQMRLVFDGFDDMLRRHSRG